MSFTTAAPNAGAILPAEYAALITKPLMAQSLAFNPAIATVQDISSGEWRVPIVTKDPSVGWVAEGEQIGDSVPELDQITVTPSKVAGIVPITRELANDSSPAAQQIVGDGLARDIAHTIDAAFFGALTAPAPSGLESLTGVPLVDGGPLDNLDPLAEAISLLATAGHDATAFVTTPAIALRLATLKAGTGSNAPLLMDSRTILQRPVFVSAKVSAGTIWTVDSSKVHTVLREDVELAVSEHTFFDTDRIAIRATLRVGFGHPAEDAITKINVSTGTEG